MSRRPDLHPCGANLGAGKRRSPRLAPAPPVYFPPRRSGPRGPVLARLHRGAGPTPCGAGGARSRRLLMTEDHSKQAYAGGEGGIRTHGARKGTPHFECGAFDHSATSPGAAPAGGALAGSCARARCITGTQAFRNRRRHAFNREASALAAPNPKARSSLSRRARRSWTADRRSIG